MKKLAAEGKMRPPTPNCQPDDPEKLQHLFNTYTAMTAKAIIAKLSEL